MIVSSQTPIQSIGGGIHGLASVIIPYWGNYAKYLDECVASVKAQTYPYYEIIVIDDETDLPTARNKGIKRCKGEWIMILDVDNLLTPDYLAKTVGQGDIVATDLQFFEQEDGIFKTPHNLVLKDLEYGNRVDANALFKKSVWEKVGGYDEAMKDGWEDYDFWYRCLGLGYKINVISEPLLLYRKHGETMSVTAGRKSEELRRYITKKQTMV